MSPQPSKVVWECPWWRVEERKTDHDGADRRWYSIHRVPTPETVTVLGLSRGGLVPLLSQWREPLQARVWEFPAGLPDEGESLEQTASREFEEETGWRPRRMVPLMRGLTSPGLTDEVFNGYLALDIEKIGNGGGLDGEQIEVHLVPFEELMPFLMAQAAGGDHVDIKSIAHVALAERRLREMGEL